MKTHEVRGIIAACLFVFILFVLVINHTGHTTSLVQAQGLPVCGDGTTDFASGESCDDGNTQSCDGCSSTCQTEFGLPPGCGPVGPSDPVCGDGTVDFANGELCDDGDRNGDCEKCSNTCQIQTELEAGCGPTGIGEEPPPNAANCTEDKIADLLVTAVFGFFSSTVPTTDIVQSIKEGAEDCVARLKAGATLEKMADEAVKYVSTGFNGNPTFVTNIGLELNRTGENAFLSFTKSGWISSVSPSLRSRLVFNLINNYNEQNDFEARISSTLNDDLYDIDCFISSNCDNSFNQNGSWDTWFAMTQNPQNNIFGVLQMTQYEADRRIEASVSSKHTEINIGDGFLSRRVCEPSDLAPNADGSLPPPNCSIVTLGNVIGQQLNKTIGSGVDLAVTTDELNESLSGIHSGLINQVLSGDGGLLGTSDFIEETPGFNDTTIGGGGGGSAGGLPTGGCPVGQNATLARADEAAAVDHYGYLRSGRTGQIVFGGPGQPAYTATIVVNDVRFDYEDSSIANAVAQMCTAQNAPCPGTGSLSEGDKQGILKLDSWSDVGSRNLVSLRKDAQGRGFHVDFYDSVAKVTGQFGPLATMEAVAQTFCDAAESGGGAGNGPDNS